MSNPTSQTSFTIEWDMGDYPGFESYDEARDFQRAHKMTGSVIVPAGVQA
ncbi:hypothetical protein Jolie2_56 [Mycobacterium phage Jolie2]|uniref:Uncharacterized protein n=1 Tax=Mycobacterium phage Jolie2 TaxID=1458831 RepID=W8EGU7_9CAUD|nr:hypothetical protein Jolie2_56 [Mycobacterium phage Jolie2]AHJ86606.1 hypothetical protein Jolie2_56 [Mycobacterium phage Jolie2]